MPRRLSSVPDELRLLDRDRPDQDRPTGFLHLDDLLDHRVELALFIAEDEVRLVVADHVPVGGDGHHFQLVDLVEFLRLRHRRTGHAGQLVVEAEVVLEGDRGEGHALALDAQPFLGLDGLVEALAPAAPGHLATGELVHDDDLAVLDDVVAVALVQRVRPEGLLEVAGEPRVGVVHVLDAEPALHLLDPLLRGGDGLVLEVDEEVAALLRAFGALLQARHQPGEGEVQVGRLLGLAADDERRARLVDEDVVDLVDDREALVALDPLVQLGDHVVAQVVEAELVVGAVGHVRGVRLAPVHRPQVQEALVRGREVRLEYVRRVVRDHPQADPEEVEDGSHPLRVAAGQVVVRGHHVDPATGQRVEDGGECRHEGLALAGLHLRDLALVQDDAAHQLLVEVAHPQGPLHRLAAHREDLGEGIVEGLLQPVVLALATIPLQLAPSLQVRMVELVLGRLVRLGDLVDLGADLRDLGADLFVGHGFEFGFEATDLVDERLDPSDLTVVGVDETGKQAHGGQV